MTNSPDETVRKGVTRALSDLAEGEVGAEEALVQLVYGELQRLARLKLAREADGHTLQATALVNEAWIRLLGGNRAAWKNSSHFFCAAASAMRSILVDHARRQMAAKRGKSPLRITLNDELAGSADEPLRILEVHEALEELARHDPNKARVVELLYFAGLGVGETAQVLGTSERTVKRNWRYCRAWLYDRVRRR